MILTRLISQTIPPIAAVLQSGLAGIPTPVAVIVPQLAKTPTEQKQ